MQRRAGRLGRPAVAALCLAAARTGAAQDSPRPSAPRRITITVRVVDSAQGAVTGVELNIVRGLNEVLASAQSNDAGRAVLQVPAFDGEYQLVGRKIGFQRATRFFERPVQDTITLDLGMRRSIQTLNAVAVTAEEDLRRKSYHIDADDIANSTRPLFDATDILAKLRPDMLDGRSGMCSLSYVWVNGVLMDNVPLNDVAVLKKNGGKPDAPPPPRPALSGVGGASPRGLRVSPIQAANDTAWSVLSRIHPEHIEEINYTDCFMPDAVHKRGSTNAAYIVLKPGIGFDPLGGTYVVDTTRKSATSVPAIHEIAISNPDTLSYRQRVLGVYEGATGKPLQGTQVIDVATGTYARTSTTGTVSLAYLNEGANAVRIHRDGYRDEALTITIAPDSTTPVTVILMRMPQR